MDWMKMPLRKRRWTKTGRTILQIPGGATLILVLAVECYYISNIFLRENASVIVFSPSEIYDSKQTFNHFPMHFFANWHLLSTLRTSNHMHYVSSYSDV